MAQQRRLLSLDALRGFDMWFIMGGAELLAALALIFPSSSFFAGLAEQMHHVSWHGLSHHDTIFPLFLFIAGVSFPFSLNSMQNRGKSQSAIFLKTLRRGCMLVFLGAIYNGLLQFQLADLRIASVLARIGLAWMLGAWVYMLTGWRTRLGVAIGLLVAYWLLLAYVPVPGMSGVDPYSLEGNWVGYVDRHFLPGRLYLGQFDPEGLLSTVPAISTALMGMLTGDWLRAHRSEWTKVGGMLLVAVVLLAVGLVWNEWMPINKNLWTSSFVCVVGAYSLAMMAIFYAVIDVIGLRHWSFFFVVIGLNSITIYLAQEFIRFSFTSNALLGGLVRLLPESCQAFGSAAAYITVCWLFLWMLYRLKIFLKV